MILTYLGRALGATLTFTQKVWEARSFVIRALICWTVGFGVLLSERSDDFDLRFRLRGNSLKTNDVTVILISEEEWSQLRGSAALTLRPLKEIESQADSYFSDRMAWEQLISHVLKYNPKSVGVSFYFAQPFSQELALSNKILGDPRVYWGANLDNDGQFLRSRAFPLNEKQQGLINLKSDGDGYLRRFSTSASPIPSLAFKLVKDKNAALPENEYALINYQGPASTFLTFTLTELLFGTLPESALKGKIIVIGARGVSNHSLLTPLGPMTRAEVLANMTNNILYDEWIKTLPLWVYAIGLLLLVILSLWITVGYSQSIAIVFLICLWILLITTSTWIFDSLHYWIPIVAPTVQLVTTFVVFLSYQLIVNEKENWKLQQEKRYLEEIEEIKNNFLSLISHDLKTPIAKIQAVADRLIATIKDEKVSTDLKTVKSSSQDLHRYIQSLLQVIRVESTDFQARKSPSDLNEIILKVIEDLMPIAREKHITITNNLEPLFSMELDSTLIYEVILNFVENAIKYSPEGSSITVTSAEIHDFVEVRVIDNGAGIPPEEVSRVWNKFYRGKQHDMSTKGSGLGLYLSKYFITLHGGETFLTSELGKETIVGFRLPLNDENEGEG